jgi:hypothetical protein
MKNYKFSLFDDSSFLTIPGKGIKKDSKKNLPPDILFRKEGLIEN